MADPQTLTKPTTGTEPTRKQPVPWNVVLLNDDDHTFAYVVELLQKLFGHPKEKAEQITKAVDKEGRAVCLTTHKEHAEFKCEQILAFGDGPLMENGKRIGAMSAVIEPAEFGGEDDHQETR